MTETGLFMLLVLEVCGAELDDMLMHSVEKNCRWLYFKTIVPATSHLHLWTVREPRYGDDAQQPADLCGLRCSGHTEGSMGRL